MEEVDDIAAERPLMANKVEDDIAEKKNDPNALLYRIDKDPSWLLSFILGFQHYLTMFGATVGLPFALAEPLCLIQTKVIGELISTLFFCSGLVTLLQTTFGVRLPIVQGGTYTFVAPTTAIMGIRGTSCYNSVIVNATTNATISVYNDNEMRARMREIQGAIMVSSLFQIFIGFTGIMGFILKFLGPLTICPTIALVGLPLFGTAGYFAGSSWGITFVTMVCITLFSQVLKEITLPNPFGQKRIPIFKLFPVLLAIFVCWALSAILTVTNIAESPRARTDYRIGVLEESEWFRVPYPGQWGVPTINIAAVFGMLAGVLASMLESIGDYYACAKLSGAPPPPKHALNRGLGCEGIGCLMTGAWGTGNGTTSYSENISAIGITRVASLRVVRCGALIMILLSVIGKFGALFATVPDPVIGGIFIIMFGMITAVGLSSLQYVDLSSMRNLFVLGTSLFLGLVVPSWINSNPTAIQTGSLIVDQIIKVLLSTNMAVGGVTGFILDNLLPGTKEERGIIKWQKSFDSDGNTIEVASVHVYDPPFVMKIADKKICKYIPFLPYYGGHYDVENTINTNNETSAL